MGENDDDRDGSGESIRGIFSFFPRYSQIYFIYYGSPGGRGTK